MFRDPFGNPLMLWEPRWRGFGTCRLRG